MTDYRDGRSLSDIIAKVWRDGVEHGAMGTSLTLPFAVETRDYAMARVDQLEQASSTPKGIPHTDFPVKDDTK